MIDWNTGAQRAVSHIQSELSKAHRGAFLWYEPQGMVLVFNNGLEKEPIPEKQMNFLKRAFELRGGTIHALAHSEDRTSWAMLVTGLEPAWAHDCVWAAWHSACSEVDPEHFEPLEVIAFVERGDLPLNMVGWCRYGVAQKTIKAHSSNPNHWKNCHPAGWTVDPQSRESAQSETDSVSDSADDQQLAQRCFAGEVAAWAEFLDRFHGPLCTSLREILGRGGSDSSRVNEIASRVWYALVRNDGELLERFDPARHVRLGTFLRDLARIEITEYFRPKY